MSRFTTFDNKLRQGHVKYAVMRLLLCALNVFYCSFLLTVSVHIILNIMLILTNVLCLCEIIGYGRFGISASTPEKFCLFTY